jgi:hypothetical protein
VVGAQGMTGRRLWRQGLGHALPTTAKGGQMPATQWATWQNPVVAWRQEATWPGRLAPPSQRPPDRCRHRHRHRHRRRRQQRRRR